MTPVHYILTVWTTPRMLLPQPSPFPPHSANRGVNTIGETIRQRLTPEMGKSENENNILLQVKVLEGPEGLLLPRS